MGELKLPGSQSLREYLSLEPRAAGRRHAAYRIPQPDLDRVGWYDKNSDGHVHAVGEKPANPWGLYDMHGNVYEWTSSLWTSDYSDHEDGRKVDPGSADSAATSGVVISPDPRSLPTSRGELRRCLLR